jgi:hypothetical protein
MQSDRIIVVEVVVETVDAAWWKTYKSRIEKEFDQEQVMIRVSACELI